MHALRHKISDQQLSSEEVLNSYQLPNLDTNGLQLALLATNKPSCNQMSSYGYNEVKTTIMLLYYYYYKNNEKYISQL